jgi:hypothetical protein
LKPKYNLHAHEIITNNNDVHFLDIIIMPILAQLSTANLPTSGNASIYFALHFGVVKFLGYVPLIIVLIKSVVTTNNYVMNSSILLNLLFGTCFRDDLLLNFKNQFTPKLPNNPSNDDVVILILLLIHPPYEFIYLSLVKEAAPLLTTALRKLTVCSSNLLNSSPYGTPVMQMPSWLLKILRQNNIKVLLSTNLLAPLQHFMLAKQIDAFSLD